MVPPTTAPPAKYLSSVTIFLLKAPAWSGVSGGSEEGVDGHPSIVKCGEGGEPASVEWGEGGDPSEAKGCGGGGVSEWGNDDGRFRIRLCGLSTNHE